MTIRLHNTMGGKEEDFMPIRDKEVSIYNCGPTVYDFAHIGNMRSYVFADTLRRVFKHENFKLKQVINITDVGHLLGEENEGEDRIEKAAKKEKKSASEIAEFYTQAFLADLKSLNIDTEGIEFPKATENIKEQIEIIKILEEKGFTYQISDGIYFDTQKFDGYGKLGKTKNSKDKKEISRVGVNPEKRRPADFALWKFSRSKRMQEWDSPWGKGFPGWHIECSAMSRKYLGQPFDIHTGGVDHIPTHHNNEIAQSEAAFDTPLANYWLHNEFVKVDGEKMSKSLGNIFTVSDLKARHIHPLSFKLWLLSAHYRSIINFTWDAVQAAQSSLENLLNSYFGLPKSHKSDSSILKKLDGYVRDDLNTPQMLALLQEAKSKSAVEKIDEVLGLNIKNLSDELHKNLPPEVLDIKKERDEARKNKDWQKSDELRREIENEGFIVEDSDNDSKVRKTLAGIV